MRYDRTYRCCPWKKLIYMHDSFFTSSSITDRVFIWKQPKDASDLDCVLLTVIHWGTFVMIRGGGGAIFVSICGMPCLWWSVWDALYFTRTMDSFYGRIGSQCNSIMLSDQIHPGFYRSVSGMKQYFEMTVHQIPQLKSLLNDTMLLMFNVIERWWCIL